MEWSYLFNPRVDRQGYLDDQSGKVRGLSRDGNIWSADVLAGGRYRVKAVFNRKGQLTQVGCSCPDAARGNFCRHMAALLYRLDGDARGNDAVDSAARENVPVGGTGKDSAPDTADGGAPAEAGESRPGACKKIRKQKLSDGQMESLTGQFSGGYHYFDFPSILRSSGIYQDVWEEGIRLARAGEITLERFELLGESDTDSRRSLMASVSAVGQESRTRYRRYDEWGSYRVSALLDRKSIVSMDCSRYRCPTVWRQGTRPGGICVHMAALLWLAGQYILEHNPGDATDREAYSFFRDFEDTEEQRRDEPSDLLLELTGGTRQDPLELEPDIADILMDSVPQVSFRVGGAKKYRIRSVRDFVKNVEQCRAMKFGAKTVLSLGEDRFAKSSVPLWEILRDEIREQDQRGLPPLLAGQKDRISLLGESMDRFFDWARGKYLPSRIPDGEHETIGFRDREQVPEILVKPGEPDGEVLESLVVESNVITLCTGRNYGYWFDGGYINRMSAAGSRALAPLLSLAKQQEEPGARFRVGRKMFAALMYDTLPALEKCCRVTVEEEDRIRACLPPETRFAFYLDTDEGQENRRAAVCLAQAVSGETTRPLQPENPREERVQRMLARYLPESLLSEEGTLVSTGGDDARLYLLLEEGVKKLLTLGEVRTTDSFRRLTVRRPSKFSVGVSLESDLLHLTVSSSEYSPDELAEILGAYRKKKKFYRMKNGDFVRLDDESLGRLEAIMQDLHLTPREFVRGRMNIPAYRTLYLDKMLENTEEIYAERDSRFRRLIKEFKTISDADFALPEALKDVLRKYQRTGYRWLRTLAEYGFGGILADEMGLGKTVQAIAVLEAEREERAAESALKEQAETSSPEKRTADTSREVPDSGQRIALIVCPASLVYNWGEELHRFAPGLRTVLVVGTQAERKEILAAAAGPDSGTDVLVTSYDLLRRDIPEYEDISFRYQIIDEAQYIKNHTTAAAKAVKLIRSGTRFALTGTPIENRLSELWSIFDYLMPGFLYGYDTFRSLFENPIVREEDQEAKERLGRMIGPFILRRCKRDVLKDLPDKLEEVRYSRMGEEQKKLYDAQIIRMKQMMGENGGEGGRFPDGAAVGQASSGRDRIRILAELTKARELCCDPSLLYENYAGGSAKREACLDLIRSAIDGGHRILVFSAFTSMLALLGQDLAAENIDFYEITGATPKQERVRLVDEFNSGSVPVFLISLKAGGTGLNLTGADVVIHYDPWWNLAAQNQATDRAHRIGQTRTVTVYRLIIKGSIEEKILNLQEAKRKLADDVMSGEAVGSGSISREELMQLLE
jgi:SNF2 family DNA or RNA helicase